MVIYAHFIKPFHNMKRRHHQYSTEFRRTTYAIQPYAVGSKGAKSLALIIPARIARQCDITPNTMFSVKADRKTKAVTLQTVKLLKEEEGNDNKKAGAVEVSDLSATAL
jgi:hypothetical protein